MSWAPLTSTDVTVPWATGDRTNTTWAAPGTSRSSTYFPAPVNNVGSSNRTTGRNVRRPTRSGGAMPQAIGMSDEVRESRARMKDFIDNVVFKAEPELERQSEHGFHPDTGLPLELYELAEERGDDTSRGLRG